MIETLAAKYYPDEIDRLFATEGWSLDRSARFRGDSARARAEEFDDLIDFTSPEEAEAYLVVVGRVLARSALAEASESWPEHAKPHALVQERIENELRRGGSEQDENEVWHLPRRVEPSDSILEVAEGTGLARIIAAMRRPDCGSEERIGLAKELVESVIKLALEDLGEPYGDSDDVPALSKRLHHALDLDASAIPVADEKAREALQRLLAALAQMPHNLATLRNAIGGGHGRAEAVANSTLVSDLAARAADAYAEFIIDTLKSIEDDR